MGKHNVLLESQKQDHEKLVIIYQRSHQELSDKFDCVHTSFSSQMNNCSNFSRLLMPKTGKKDSLVKKDQVIE